MTDPLEQLMKDTKASQDAFTKQFREFFVGLGISQEDMDRLVPEPTNDEEQS